MDKNPVDDKGSHRSVDGENKTVELITEGRLYEKDGAYHIEYEESEISGRKAPEHCFPYRMMQFSWNVRGLSLLRLCLSGARNMLTAL